MARLSENDASIAIEPEITQPVDLCDPARPGFLSRSAVGWTRRPLHRCNLTGRRGARKRWNYWAFTTPTHLFSATVANLDYAGLAFVYLIDFERRDVAETTVVTPFGRGCRMPDEVAGEIVFAHPKLGIEIKPADDATRLRVRAADLAGRPVEAELVARHPAGHETLGVVIPWSDRRFQYTAKHNALPAEGEVALGGARAARLRFEGDESFACLDFGRGVWPRRAVWNWGSASGRQGGVAVGLNLGGVWTDGTGMTENAVCVDGRLHKISESLAWEYSSRDFLQPWRIVAPKTRDVDLRFTPFVDRVARTNSIVVRSEVHQLVGHYDGTIRDEQGRHVEISGLLGWAEEHVARW